MWMFNRLRTGSKKWNRLQYIVIASIYFKTFWNNDNEYLFTKYIFSIHVTFQCIVYTLRIRQYIVCVCLSWQSSEHRQLLLINILNPIILNVYRGLKVIMLNVLMPCVAAPLFSSLEKFCKKLFFVFRVTCNKKVV